MNPWLNIPAEDYEGHMNSPEVDQLSFLSAAFEQSLENHDCDTVALLGCATGNGLEHVKSGATHRVTAVDINPEYLEVLRRRHGDRVVGLEVVHADLENCELDRQAYSLIFAGLVFEYVEPSALLRRISGWLGANGVLIAVLQLPAPGSSVTKTPYTSLESLNSIIELIDPKQFRKIAAAVGLTAVEENMVTLETGKSFYVGAYRNRS